MTDDKALHTIRVPRKFKEQVMIPVVRRLGLTHTEFAKETYQLFDELTKIGFTTIGQVRERFLAGHSIEQGSILEDIEQIP